MNKLQGFGLAIDLITLILILWIGFFAPAVHEFYKLLLLFVAFVGTLFLALGSKQP
jgi:hypothetical protein